MDDATIGDPGRGTASPARATAAELDVCAYAARYTGRTRLLRLLFIADRCGAEATELEALRMLHEDAMERQDAVLYRHATLRIKDRLGPGYAYDQHWVDSIEPIVPRQREEEKLPAGDLHGHCYKFEYVIDDVNKEVEAAVHIAKMRADAGLTYMKDKEYKLAALEFLETGPELGSNYSEVIAPQDIAIYGALCALATFRPSQVKKKVIDNSKFNYFLELVPEVMELVNDFNSRNFGSCWQHLMNLKPNLSLDIYLCGHVKTLYKNIWCKILSQMDATRKMASTCFDYLNLSGLDNNSPVPDQFNYATTDFSGEPNLANTAILAYLAGRYDDVLLAFPELGHETTPYECEILRKAYVHIMDSKLQYIQCLEREDESDLISGYTNRLRSELQIWCSERIIEMRERIKLAHGPELLFLHQMIAMILCHVTTTKFGLDKNEALGHYFEANDAAEALASTLTFTPDTDQFEKFSFYSPESRLGGGLSAYVKGLPSSKVQFSSSDSDMDVVPESTPSAEQWAPITLLRF